jgi:hypothetical protein
MKVLYPPLGEAKLEVRMSTPEKWFSNVDKNGDLKIDADELSAHLKRLSF